MILLLQETKCDTLGENIKNFLWSSKEHSWLDSPVRGLSGGLLTSWNNNLFKMTSYHQNYSWLWIRGILSNSSDFINCINIYNPNELHD